MLGSFEKKILTSSSWEFDFCEQDRIRRMEHCHAEVSFDLITQWFFDIGSLQVSEDARILRDLVKA